MIEAQIQLAADVGAITERVSTDRLDPRVFIRGLADVLGAQGGILALRLDEAVVAFTDGLDDDRARRLLGRGVEPRALLELERCGVDRLSDLVEDFGGDLMGLEEDLMNRLGVKHALRVANGVGALLLCRFSEAGPFCPKQVAVLRSLEGRLADALGKLAEGHDPQSSSDVLRTLEPEPPLASDFPPLHASCPIPLILVDNDVHVVRANPAAIRKLDMHGEPLSLPTWLLEALRERLDELLTAGGIPDGVSGDYQFVQPYGRRMMRLGLVPLEGDDSAARWLVSVEHGGPSVDERLAALASRYSLKATEVEILELLVEGLRNARISEELRIAEATVKYRLGRVMEKTGTTNRADLIATVFSELPTR